LEKGLVPGFWFEDGAAEAVEADGTVTFFTGVGLCVGLLTVVEEGAPVEEGFAARLNAASVAAADCFGLSTTDGFPPEMAGATQE
jgi:hypothetical protein